MNKINPKKLDSMTELEKNMMVAQYEPLVSKIVKQFVNKLNVPWDDIKSMAYEGLALAINGYDPKRSKMTFVQYAGFAIRNNILTGLNNELRTVKLSAYAQKKAIERGDAVFNSVGIDYSSNDNTEHINTTPKKNEWDKLSISDKWSDGDVFETLYSKLEDNFPIRDREIFYMTFGLNGYEELKGKDIASLFNISCSLVSIRLKAIIKFIQHDEELVEILANLLK